MRKYLFIALSLAFVVMAFVAFQQGKPSPKAPIYQTIKTYSPYYLDKRFGGLQIMSKTDVTFKEKPVNIEIFHRLDYLEQTWGKNHLKLINNQLTVLDDNQSIVTTLSVSTQEDLDFLHHFYGI